MRSAHRFFQILKGQVGVELGAGDLRMSQDGLDVPKSLRVNKRSKYLLLYAFSATVEGWIERVLSQLSGISTAC